MMVDLLPQSTSKMEFQLARSALGLKVLRLHLSGAFDPEEVPVTIHLRAQRSVGD